MGTTEYFYKISKKDNSKNEHFNILAFDKKFTRNHFQE